MTTHNDLTILVNSTDSFEDCWKPFFTLFSTYWHDCPYPIVLNTETKYFSYPNLNISCSQIGIEEPDKRLSWSDCLIRCLDKINTKYVLYLQDDYFLNAPVDSKTLNEFLQIMDHEGYSHIQLMEVNRNKSYEPSTRYPLIWKIPQKANYRINLQAGLWVKDRLRFYLRPNETGWQFERWGTRRAQKVADSFFCQNLEYFNEQDRYIFPYEFTGIVRGKWLEAAVVDLFKQHGIEVDFSRRGFYQLNLRQKLIQMLRTKARHLFMRYAP